MRIYVVMFIFVPFNIFLNFSEWILEKNNQKSEFQIGEA